MENEKCCAYCRWYDGFIHDNNEFCDERETYVNATDCCYKFKRKSDDSIVFHTEE